MSSNNENGRFGEIANQSAIVVNCQQDMNDITARMNVNPTKAYIFMGAPATADNSTVRVDINDLVFTVGDGKNSRRGMMNNAIPVTSNCNGLFIYKTKATIKVVDEKDEEEVRQALSETIRPIGQALGASCPLPESEGNLKTNFTVRTHGTGHIINTGDKTLVPGDTVCWDLFKKEEIENNEDWKRRFARYGYSIRKVPLKLVKLSHASASFEWALVKEMKTRAMPATNPQQIENKDKARLKTAQGKFANGIIDFFHDIDWIIKNPNNTSIQDMEDNRMKGDNMEDFKNAAGDDVKKKAINDLIQSIMYLVNDLDRRRVGTALSYAKAGKGVDMLLQF